MMFVDELNPTLSTVEISKSDKVKKFKKMKEMLKQQQNNFNVMNECNNITKESGKQQHTLTFFYN
jgi:hypothetical protein